MATAKTTTIAVICAFIRKGEYGPATSLLKRDYPFARDPITVREYEAIESTRVFIRDGFIDRYTMRSPREIAIGARNALR
jgi:hypothetical protein